PEQQIALVAVPGVDDMIEQRAIRHGGVLPPPRPSALVQERPDQHLVGVAIQLVVPVQALPGEVELGEGGLGQIFGQVPVAAQDECRLPEHGGTSLVELDKLGILVAPAATSEKCHPSRSLRPGSAHTRHWYTRNRCPFALPGRTNSGIELPAPKLNLRDLPPIAYGLASSQQGGVVDRSQAREQFEEFVRSRSAALGRSAYLLTGDVHHAEDLLQTALERAAVRWERLDDPEAYVRRVLYTQTVSWWRHRRRRPPETLSDASIEVPAATTDVETRLVLQTALARLTPRQRAV